LALLFDAFLKAPQSWQESHFFSIPLGSCHNQDYDFVGKRRILIALEKCDEEDDQNDFRRSASRDAKDGATGMEGGRGQLGP
jgi:hypothetical protein